MSRYHQNAKEIPSIGRHLQAYGEPPSLAKLQSMLHPDEVLIGYYDGIIRQIAPALTSQKDVDEFYGQYMAGHFVRMGYYAVPKDKLNLR
jgi:hypothetical protein